MAVEDGLKNQKERSSVMEWKETVRTDVLIIGAGLAGLKAAERAKRYGLDVVIVDKSTGRTNLSSVAGGAIGILAGAWQISNPFTLRSLTERGILGGAWEIKYCKDQRMEEITAMEEVPLQDELAEFGCVNPRNMKTYGPYIRMNWAATGPLYHYVQKVGCKLMKFFTVTDLLKVDGQVVGVVGFESRRGHFMAINAKAVVLATGGAGSCWARNNTPFRSTGDGHAIAYRNGVVLHMMEYESFDAWIIAEKGIPNYWIPPSYARTMGNMLNAKGEDFLPNYIELGPKATLKPGDPFHIKYGTPVIDVVATIARAMAMEVHEGRGDDGAILVDFSNVPDEVWYSEPKGIAFLHLMRDFDWKKKPVHMYPGALGSYGGCKITEEGETNLPGLFSGGEVAYGEDLKYTNVFGTRAGRAAAEYAVNASLIEPDPIQIKEKKDYLEKFLSRPKSTDGDPKAIRGAVRDLSMEKFGVLKSEEGLIEGIKRLADLRKVASEKMYASDPRELRMAFEVESMFDCQKMHARAALIRTETRGVHNRLDYPYMDNDLWVKEIRIQKVGDEMKLSTAPIRRGYVEIPKGRFPIKGMYKK